MFIDITYQDWEQITDKAGMIGRVIDSYKASADFLRALEGLDYFKGDNAAIRKKTVLRADVLEYTDPESGVTELKKTNRAIKGTRIPANFFQRFVCQENQFLLGNGVQLDQGKDKLGNRFDVQLMQMGQWALVQGVCWGYWNLDRLEILRAAEDALSGFVSLADERTGQPRVGVQFWQISEQRAKYARVFEEDGVTVWQDSGGWKIIEPKRAYKVKTYRDAGGVLDAGGENYDTLPVIPLYANDLKTSELTPSIKAKIDAYDRILSDFGDNLDRANEVYWVLNNFGGNQREILQMLQTIRDLKAVANISDGSGQSATAEPRTIEVPFAARQAALDILEKALYQDAMALNINEITGGSLTNVAIQAAMTNLNLKVDRFEWQVFDFVRRILLLCGIDTDGIRFTRSSVTNIAETVDCIYRMREDIDLKTALKLNPLIQEDEIEGILAAKDAERESGAPDMDALNRLLAAERQAGARLENNGGNTPDKR